MRVLLNNKNYVDDLPFGQLPLVSCHVGELPVNPDVHLNLFRFSFAPLSVMKVKSFCLKCSCVFF